MLDFCEGAIGQSQPGTSWTSIVVTFTHTSMNLDADTSTFSRSFLSTQTLTLSTFITPGTVSTNILGSPPERPTAVPSTETSTTTTFQASTTTTEGATDVSPVAVSSTARPQVSCVVHDHQDFCIEGRQLGARDYYPEEREECPHF